MINCRYVSGRIVPISLDTATRLYEIDPERFTLVLVKNGFIHCLINGARCYVNSKAVLCLSKHTRFELIASYDLDAAALSFAPEFINPNLKWDVIESFIYEDLCKKHRYPRFKLFLELHMRYMGIICLKDETFAYLSASFDTIQRQLVEQPDEKWSCRSRSCIRESIGVLEMLQAEYMNDMKLDKLFLQVCNHIEMNLGKKISVEAVCRKFATNHTTLFNKFKEYADIPFSLYVIHRRLEKAKNDLAFTCLSLAEIAEISGFKKSSYLTRVFKQNTGMTPMEYRKNMRGARPDKTTI